MHKELVIFDIDKTIVDCQSQQLFLKYAREKKMVSFRYYYRIIIWFLLYKLQLVDNPLPVMEYAYSFMRGISIQKARDIIEDFYQTSLIHHIYAEARAEIEKHRSYRRDIVLLTNIADVIAARIAQDLKISRIVSTHLEKSKGMYTGKIIGNIVYGKNKANLSLEIIDGGGYEREHVWIYADHYSDKDMLELAGHPVAVNPDSKLKSIAKKCGWDVLYFSK